MATVANPSVVPERRVVLQNVGWTTYERLLAEQGDASAPRFAYDRGLLEIVSPGSEHERDNRNLTLLVQVVAEEWSVDVVDVGSMTYRRRDVQRGFEPDTGFYVQNEDRVSARQAIDPTVDPPPDLVIEIDVTKLSLNKLPIYAEMGVPEVWRIVDQRVLILTLDAAAYREMPTSLALPLLTSEMLTRFLAESRSSKRNAWVGRLRAWARVQRRNDASTD